MDRDEIREFLDDLLDEAAEKERAAREEGREADAEAHAVQIDLLLHIIMVIDSHP